MYEVVWLGLYSISVPREGGATCSPLWTTTVDEKVRQCSAGSLAWPCRTAAAVRDVTDRHSGPLCTVARASDNNDALRQGGGQTPMAAASVPVTEQDAFRRLEAPSNLR